ncbi:MAG: DUF4352 domain-containing protein [Candidatus Kerfeldbacteria bacterium]|nr:DUF4352 domain-containing protein [Candidatus Kerfeldbacteria bacterium]
MRISFQIGVTLVAVIVLAGAGCIDGSNSKTNAPTRTNPTNATSQSTPKTYQISEAASAGDIVHTITSVEALDTIPSSYTLPEWEIIAEELPADEGFQWLHIKGEVTNNTKESQSVDSTNVYVMDADGNKFDVSTDTTIYVPDDASPVYISVQPTQTIEWEGYFMVPQQAEGLVFVGNDLSFLPEAEVQVDLEL